MSDNDSNESFRAVYRRSVQAIGGEFRLAEGRGAVNGGAVQDLARSLLSVVFEGEAPVSTLLAMKDRKDYALVHSINVAVLAALQASALGLNDEEVHEISVAGLMHDIGKTKLPPEILHQQTPLSDQQWSLLASHTVEGARILMDSKGMVGVAPLVAYCHHQSYTEKSLLATELVRLADVFDNIRTIVGFDDAPGMRATAGYMILALRDRFNPYLLERFGALCQVFRPGDASQLTTGERATVVAPHAELSLRPKVEITREGNSGAKVGDVVDLSDPPPGVTPSLMVPQLPDVFTKLEPHQIARMA